MTNDAERPGKINDKELQRRLSAADEELLNQVRATIDPDAFIAKIMGRDSSILAIRNNNIAAEDSTAHQIIRIRVIMVSLVRSLDHSRPHLSITRIRDLVLDLDRLRTLNGDRVLDLDLDRDLGYLCVRVIHLAVLRLPVSLAEVHRRAQHMAQRLSAQEVDASDIDLSNAEIRNLDALDGVVWTDGTKWPSGLRAQVERNSDKIGSGRWKVRLGQKEDEPLILLPVGGK